MAIRACVVLMAVLTLGALAPRHACALDNATRDRILASQTRLAAALMTRVPPDPTTGAVMVSPASVAGMLAPLAIAGDVAHRSAMAGVLQFAPGSTQSHDLAVTQGIATAAMPGEAVETATRYVFAPGFPPTAEAAGRLVLAKVEAIVADPASSEVRAENDTWVDKVTHGKITSVSPPPPGTVLAAFNALHFKGRWATPFKTSATRPADFYEADGAKVRAPFMHSSLLPEASREDARFVAVDLSFSDGRYAMVVLTTRDEPAGLASFADHLAWLDGRGFQTARPVVVDLPRFEASSTQHLLGALLGLGLDPAEVATGLTTTPVPLAQVDQTVKLVVNEEGAEMAALTDGFEAQSGLVSRGVLELIVDKPFAFALRDKRTGLVVAEGFVSSIDGKRLTGTDPIESARSNSMMSWDVEHAK